MGVSVRQQRRDGQWYVYIRHKGERVSYKCKNEEQAREAESAITTAIQSHQFSIDKWKSSEKPTKEPKVSSRTLRDYYDKTLQPLWEGSLSRNTYKSYDGSFRVHILPVIGDSSLASLDRDSIKTFITKLQKKRISLPKKKATDDKTPEAPPEPKEQPRLLSKESIRNIIAALRAGCSEALESGLMLSNPAVRLGKFYKEAQDFREEIDPFTAEEVSTLLHTTREHYDFQNYVLMLTLFHCGLRAGEASGLHWSDLDEKNKLLLVRRQITRGKKGKPKTRKKRSVDVSTVLLKELQALKRIRKAEYLKEGKNDIPDLMFMSPGDIVWEDGKPTGQRKNRGHVDMDNWRNRVFWKACDKAGIRRRRVHDTRHTFASLHLKNGEPLKYIQAQLGHSSIRMTADVYGHLEVGSNRGAADRLPSLEKTQHKA